MSTLYVIGVGPGDPELLTLKALRILRDVSVIFVPKGREDGQSLALSITGRVVDLNGKEIRELHFPMVKTRVKTASGDREIVAKWDVISQEIINALQSKEPVRAASNSAAFLTLGDPCLYSTFFYLYDRLLSLMPDLRIEIVPGVPSINAAAARAELPLGLGDERIAIVPANYEDFERFSVEHFDTVVFMKVDRTFEQLRDYLLRKGLADRAIYASRVGMGDERIKSLLHVTDEDLNYFSMIIVRK